MDESSNRRDESLFVPQLPGRIPSLDGLRAISILCVVLGHAHESHSAPAALNYFQHLGNLGVRCFFIISGLLITTLLLKENLKTGAISLKSFYYRRSLRIFPASLTYIGIVAALSAAGLIYLAHNDLLHAITYTINYHVDRSIWLDHLWSLSVEEQFYIIWPSIIIFLGVHRSNKVAWWVIAIAPIVRLFMWNVLHASPVAMNKQFQATADALATGCILAMNYNRLSSWKRYQIWQRSKWFWPSTIALIGAGNLMFLASQTSFYLFGETMVNVGIVLAIDWAIRNSVSLFGRFLNCKPMVYVGVLSYSLYLWQYFFLNDARTPWRTNFPINIGVAFAVAIASYNLIEKPFLRLKDLGPRKGAISK